MTGKIEGLIYPNAKIIDEMPPLIPSVLGLDFGFNHKTALIETGQYLDRLFWHELIYQSETHHWRSHSINAGPGHWQEKDLCRSRRA
jgi:hypothetical protein